MISETLYLLSKPVPKPLFEQKPKPIASKPTLQKRIPSAREEMILKFLKETGGEATTEQIKKHTKLADSSLYFSLERCVEDGTVQKTKRQRLIVWRVKKEGEK